MEAVEKFSEVAVSRTLEGEEGEILEDGEIDEEEVVEDLSVPKIESETIIEEEEVVINEEEEEISEEEEQQRKHRKRSHHRRRKRKHDEHKSDEKKSRHKKRKGDDGSEGNESPPSKKKKKRKKHSREKKSTSSPEVEDFENSRLSESPPLPSEQSSYNYGSYDPMDPYNSSYKSVAAYDPSAPYTGPNMTAYSYDTYTNEVDYSSGSDSYYSDFESHLKQYQNYKQNKTAEETGSGENNDNQTNKDDGFNDDDDDDNYYSVGYDAEQREKRRLATDTKKRRSSSSRNRSDVNGDKSSYGNRRRKVRKIPELCQHYLNGSCQLGDKCNYMHEEYPCKYYHTGTQCLNGDSCKFSHEQPNQDTQRIIKQFQDAFNTMDDSKEIEALQKVGIKPLDKPPPGMGLLPTPSSSLMLSNNSEIPSLMDLVVQPTPELQQKIDADEVACLKMTDDDITDIAPVSLPIPIPPFPNPATAGPGLLPLPNVAPPGMMAPPLIPNFPPPPTNLLGAPPVMLSTGPAPTIPPPILPPGSATPPWILRQQALLKQEQEEVQEFYKKLYGQTPNPATDAMQNEENYSQEQTPPSKSNSETSIKKHEHFNTDHNDDEINQKETEDIIRINEDGTVKDESKQAPDFLPAKQKALFMRIQQKGDLADKSAKSTDKDWDSIAGISNDNWTYSSDEEEKETGRNKSTKSSESVQSIISMISNKKNDKTSAVDTNLLSKVANAINMPPESSASISHSSNKPMMSPTSHPTQRKDRRGSGNGASPSHHHSRDLPVRRRLSTSELYKEPITIPLVAKQNSDSMRVSHPDPRVSLSRLFGKTKTEFRASIPVFGKDVMIPGSVKMTGLKITLSSTDTSKIHTNGDKRTDPRLLHSHSRPRSGDPRMKPKPNDPRLRSRGSSTHKTSPPQSTPAPVTKSPSIPPTPTALLTKPASSIIPSLPELNLDLAPQPKPKVAAPPISPASTKPGDPLARLPKLLRASVRPASNRLARNSIDKETPKEAPTIAPYDPRYITAGSSPTSIATKPKITTATSVQPAPYDPRVISSDPRVISSDPRAISSPLSSVPPLLDSRASNQEMKKPAIPLPKLTPAPRLTPAPGYAPKCHENGKELPSGEAVDF